MEGSPTHINASQWTRARLNLWFICGSANSLGAVNGRNADGLGVLEGLLYEVRGQVLGIRAPGGDGCIVSDSSTGSVPGSAWRQMFMTVIVDS